MSIDNWIPNWFTISNRLIIWLAFSLLPSTSNNLSNTFFEKLLLREIESNDKIEEYIANNFSDIYNERKISSNGNWDLSTSKETIKRIWTDGGIRFLLQQKLTKLKSKKLILQDLILPKLVNGINVYQNLYKDADWHA